MKTQQDRQSNGNSSKSPALNETRATTSRQVQREAADNTSHPGRSGPDELVPSRYALRVGEIDVLVVSDGVLPLPTAMLAIFMQFCELHRGLFSIYVGADPRIDSCTHF